MTYSLDIEESASWGEPNNTWVAWDICRLRREDVTVGDGQSLRRGLTSLKSADYNDLDILNEDGLNADLGV